jgi:hypothetical protein
MKPATTLGVFLIALIAFGHLLRLLFSWDVIINATAVPMWPSVVVVLLFGALSVLIYREHRGT